MKNPSSVLAGRVLRYDVVFFVLECIVFAGAFRHVQPPEGRWPHLLWLASGLFALAALVLWVGVLSRLFSPIADLTDDPKGGDPRPRAIWTLHHLALLSLGFRTVLFLGVVLLIGAVGRLRFGLPEDTPRLLLGLVLVLLPPIDTLRALLVQRALSVAVQRYSRWERGLPWILVSHRSQIVFSSLSTVIFSTGAMLGFSIFFGSATPSQIRSMFLIYPMVPVGFLALYILSVLWLLSPIHAYLKQLLLGQRGLTDLARLSHKRAQRLPYTLGALALVLTLSSSMALLWFGKHEFHLPQESAALLFGAALLCGLSAALYQVLWHRSILAPLLLELSMQSSGELPLRTPLRLRTKMMVSFGTLTLLSGALSMFFSMAQYQTLASRYNQRTTVLVREAGEESPALQRPLGANTDLRMLRVLVVFFLILLGGSLGVVVLAASDLTRPLRDLEKRAEAMAKGDLERSPIGIAVEADEVGRLSAAFEEMRQALSERFRSSTEINFALEAQVARRTQELERRNLELKDALSALQAAQKELVDAEKMASMGRLVAGIAHEINNPINAVVNTAGPLQEATQEMTQALTSTAPSSAQMGASLEEMRAMLRVIQRGARRTMEIVQALHNYSRGDGGQAAEVDIHRCLNESLDLLQHDLKRGIRIERDEEPIGRVWGHGGQLQQVFMNLLTNAVQALSEPKQKEAPRITITTRRDGNRAMIRIADNGPGIPKETLPRIFDPFFTTKDVGEGSGLGLSIVHGIVDRHGGSIRVEPGLTNGSGGRGTAMIISLPVSGA